MASTKWLERTNALSCVLQKLASLFELSCTWFRSLLSDVSSSCIWLTKVNPFLVISEVLKPPATQNNKKRLVGFNYETIFSTY